MIRKYTEKQVAQIMELVFLQYADEDLLDDKVIDRELIDFRENNPHLFGQIKRADGSWHEPALGAGTLIKEDELEGIKEWEFDIIWEALTGYKYDMDVSGLRENISPAQREMYEIRGKRVKKVIDKLTKYQERLEKAKQKQNEDHSK